MGNKITRSKIETYAYGNILEVIDNRSNIADPRDVGGTKIRRFVYDADPFVESLNFSHFPYIVLDLPTVDYEDTTVNAKHKRALWKQDLMVATARRGSSNTYTDIGRTDMMNICDDIHETFNKETVKAALRLLNIFNLKIEKVDQDMTLIEGKDVYTATFEISYSVRLATSA